MSPIRPEDLAPLANALVSPTTWFSRTRGLKDPSSFSAYFGSMISRQERGECLMLMARLASGKEIVGMSTFQYPSADFRRVEIGFSWIADQWQRTFVNSEMKLLMLTHAFEVMKASRVKFAVHPSNDKSNAAMKRLGATFEGTLRKWRFVPGHDDGNRNLYSIIDTEWLATKDKITVRLK